MNTPNEREEYLFQVNLGGMIDILSNHLYSSPDVFIRELLQNAVDAIAAKRKKYPQQTGKNQVTIELLPDQTLIFTDTGTGLTEAEIHKFLAVIGQSSKHDLTSGKVQEDYIGRFGIGLLSCFLVSDVIRVQTRSLAEPDRSLEWRGNPDGTYTITPCDMLPECGTRIILTAKKDAEQYFDAKKISTLVQYYGLPLPEPIILVADGTQKRLNPPFPTADTPLQQVMELGESVFGEHFLSYIPLESPSGLFSGAAFILPYETAATATHTHRIYLKNMLLTEDGSKLLPKWAFFVRCFLNTKGLQPTASREDFYVNDVLLNAKQELSDCITNYLQQLSARDPQLLQQIIRIHSLAVKSVAIEDDALFCAFFPYLQFETSYGMLYGRDLLDYDQTIMYAAFADEFRQLSAISRARDIMLVNGGYTYISQLLERITLLKPDADVTQLKSERLDDMLDKPDFESPVEAMRLLAECNELLAPYDCSASFKRFAPAELPVLYTVNDDALLLRDIQRSIETAQELFQGMLGAFAEEYSETAVARLYLNSDNTLIQRLMKVKDEERLKCCLEILYVQALMTGGYPMRRHEMSLLNRDLLNLLTWSTE